MSRRNGKTTIYTLTFHGSSIYHLRSPSIDPLPHPHLLSLSLSLSVSVQIHLAKLFFPSVDINESIGDRRTSRAFPPYGRACTELCSVRLFVSLLHSGMQLGWLLYARRDRRVRFRDVDRPSASAICFRGVFNPSTYYFPLPLSSREFLLFTVRKTRTIFRCR